jgi:type IV pilus assembly protein PilN
MKDLNFFEPYIEKSEFKFDNKFIVAGICILAFLALGTHTIYNSMVIKQETRIIQSLKITAENPTTLKKINEIRKKENEVNEFRDSVEKIRYLNQIITERDIIDENLLGTINHRIPEDLFFTSFSIFNREIQIVGISKDKWSIAELGKGLEDLESLEEIFISNISLQDNAYNFTINITLKDVEEYGTETTKEGPPSEEPEN